MAKVKSLKLKVKSIGKGPAHLSPPKAKLGGFTLVETLVAILIFTFGVLGPLALAAKVISAGQVSKNRLIASNLAQEAYDLVRNVRDENIILGGAIWDNYTGPVCSGVPPQRCLANGTYEVGVDTNGLKLADPLPNGRYLYMREVCSGADTCYEYRESSIGGSTRSLFQRSVALERQDSLAGRPVKVTITVSWTEASGTKSIVVEGKIYDWP